MRRQSSGLAFVLLLWLSALAAVVLAQQKPPLASEAQQWRSYATQLKADRDALETRAATCTAERDVLQADVARLTKELAEAKKAAEPK